MRTRLCVLVLVLWQMVPRPPAQVRITTDAIMPTIDVSVTASDNDASETGATAVTINGASFNVDATGEWAGFRFTGITIPAGATITAAYLTLYYDSGTLDEPDLRIYAEDGATPAAFLGGAGNNGNISNRTRTTASVDWSNTDLGAPGSFNSADLSTVVQELVNSYAPYSSGAMVFLVTSANGTGTRDAQFVFFDEGVNPAPALHIEYTEAGGAARVRRTYLAMLGVS